MKIYLTLACTELQWVLHILSVVIATQKHQNSVKETCFWCILHVTSKLGYVNPILVLLNTNIENIYTKSVLL